SLFGLGAGVRARRIHEGYERKVEFLREPVEAHRLAVALGVRHAEVANDVLLGRRALLLSDDDDRAALELGDPADDRRVVAERAVSVKLLKLLEHSADDVERVRARDVARRLHGLPRGRRCRADGAECDLRDVALKTPAQVLSRDTKRVQEERDALLELRARHNLVDEAVFEEKLGSLETLRQLLADRLARHACAGEADERARFGEDDVAERRE